MDASKVILTEIDRLILRSYDTMLDGLADYLGEGYELVLHSLEDLEHSVIKIVNGHHTGRTVGAPITDLALTMLERIQEQDVGGYISYFTKNKKGDPLKASTTAIYGERGQVIGLLCMNFYLNTPLVDIIATLSKPATQPVLFEAFGDDTTELICQAVEQAHGVVMNNAAISPSLKNREIVAALHTQGIFKLKNAVELVADAMSISKNTVYLHLRNIGN